MVDHHASTIQYLPSELLLHIFSFHRLLSGEHNRPPPAAWRWHTLAHVCQRWRNLIFTSLRHLEARLIMPRKSPETPLDSWPALPLSVWYESYAHTSEKQIADVVAAFEHSERIREIRLLMKMDYSFWTPFRNKSFPELEHLALLGINDYSVPITLPREFLGGPTSPRRLRNIFLDFIHLPALPQLLLSSRDLVSLHLGSSTLTRNGFISPVVLSTALSATTQLEYLYIRCNRISPEHHPELTSVNSSPRNLVVLPALTHFEFVDSIYYLENLVSRIHAPHLLKLRVYCEQRILDVPRLSQFISRTERLSSSPSRTSITFECRDFTIKHHFRRLPSPQGASFVLFTGHYMATLQVSQVDHICAQLCPLASSTKRLKLSVFAVPPLPLDPLPQTDPTPWLQLLTPYDSVEEIEFLGAGAACTGIGLALQQSTWKTARELLPALRVLKIRGFHPERIRLTMLFAAARRLTGRPVIVHRLRLH